MSQDACANKFQVVNNVIKYPGKKHEPTRGLGWYYYEKMRKNLQRPAQINGLTGEVETYGEFLKKCVRTAIALKSRGIREGDVVTVCSHNHMDTYVPVIASYFIGAIVSNTDPGLSLDDSVHLISMVKPKIVFASSNVVDLIENVLQKTGLQSEIVVFGESQEHTEFTRGFLGESPEELNFEPTAVDEAKTATIYFSSGTSGLAKGICLSSRTIVTAEMFIRKRTNKENDLTLTFSSPYWISGSVILTDVIRNGTPKLILPSFDLDQIWDVIKTYKVHFLLLTPTQLTSVLKAGRPNDADTSSLISFAVGGSPLTKDQLEMTRRIFPNAFIFFGYGQTEMGSGCLGYDLLDPYEVEMHRRKVTSVGRPFRGFDYKVVDLETEKPVGPNQTGELRVKCTFPMNGYHNQDSSNAFDSQGFLKTGDVAYYDEDYCFYIVDRIKEMLKYQGWQITPAKLEGILLAHPQVEKAIVIGIPHPEDGDHPMGVVVLKKSSQDVTARELEKFVEGKVDDKQRLRAGVRIVSEIPQTPSDKLKRKYIKDLVLSGKLQEKSIM